MNCIYVRKCIPPPTLGPYMLHPNPTLHTISKLYTTQYILEMTCYGLQVMSYKRYMPKAALTQGKQTHGTESSTLWDTLGSTRRAMQFTLKTPKKVHQSLQFALGRRSQVPLTSLLPTRDSSEPEQLLRVCGLKWWCLLLMSFFISLPSTLLWYLAISPALTLSLCWMFCLYLSLLFILVCCRCLTLTFYFSIKFV